MRNMLLALAALGVVTLSTAVIADDGASILEAGDAVAAPVAEPQPLPDAVAAQPVAVQQQGHVHRHRAAPKKRQGVLAKLIELERRKNAWLKKTFLGR